MAISEKLLTAALLKYTEESETHACDPKAFEDAVNFILENVSNPEFEDAPVPEGVSSKEELETPAAPETPAEEPAP